MKKKIISLCVVAALVLSFFGLTRLLSSTTATTFGVKSGMVSFSELESDITDDVLNAFEEYVIAENDQFIMMADQTASPVLRSKQTGMEWRAVPQTPFGNTKYNSALSIKYYSNDSTEVTLYSAESCVDKKQIRVHTVENGYQVEYGFGELEESTLYPEIISKKRMELFLKKMSDEDAEYILRRYAFYDLNEMEDGEGKNYIIKEFPRLKEEPLYIVQDISTKLIKKRTSEIFSGVGYTLEDKQKDSGLMESEKPQSFVIAVNYLLTESGFLITLDSENCRFYGEYPLKSICFLPYFDGIAEQEKAHFLIPAGSGATVNIASGEREIQRSFPIYGENTALSKTIPSYNSQCMLPVFGQYRQKQGFFCIVGTGAQQSSIELDRNGVCSGISPNFVLIDSGTYKMGAQNPIELFADRISDSGFSAEYVLLDKLTEDNAYSLMAKLYREKLTAEKILEKNHADSPAFLAEIVNGLNYDDMALGCIPTNREFTLTSFGECEKIADEIAEYTDPGNLNITITGWNKNGINRQKLGAVQVSRKAGGENDLAALKKHLDSAGVQSYLDVNFVMTENFKDDGFSPSDDAARTINNNIVIPEKIDALKYTLQPTAFNLVSPDMYEKYWQGYRRDKTICGFDLNVSQLTAVLTSDYTDGEEIYRKQTISTVQKILGEAKKDGRRLMGEAANLYAIKFLDLISNVPMTASDDSLFDREIPFLQMVLHGSVSYVSDPLNGYSDLQKTILKLIETGTGVHYRITNNQFDGLFETDASYLYNTNYNVQKELMKKCYVEVNKALSGLSSCSIRSHSYLTDNVVCVTYENGTKLYINYGNTRYTAGEITVNSLEYLRVD